MYDRYFDVVGGLIAFMFLVVLARLIISRPSGWRDISVTVLTGASCLFWILIALRRIFAWPIEIAVLAFALKLIGATGVAIHVWTVKRVSRS